MKTAPENLVSAAAELLDRGGPGAVTLRGLGSAAGVSRGAAYHHFAAKTDLLAAIAAQELDRLAEAFLTVDKQGAAAAREMMSIYVRWALEFPERFRLTFGRWETDDARLGAATARVREPFVRAVVEAQGMGDMPAGDPVGLAALLLSTVHGAADLAAAGHLSPTRAGRIDVNALTDDLFCHLQAAARP